MPEPESTTLAGGERVVSERIPGVRSVALGLWIATGSRDEPRSRAGVSHFIEHLLFKGSSRYGAQEIAELFDAMGGELNAATSRETTVLYTRVPDGRLEQALDAMADMVFAPTFDDVDSEREVVLEEIAMVDDNPQDLVHDLAAEAVFGTHPLGRPVIGTADVISQVSPRALRSWHGGAYVGSNVVLSAAGNVHHDRLVELFAKLRPRRRSAVSRPSRAARAASRSRATASCAAAPSSTTSCSPRRGSRATTSGATPCRSWTRSSAARRRPASSRRSARSGGWRTASTRTARSTRRPARSGSTSARGRTTCASAST